MNESVVEQVDRFSKNLNPKTSLAALHRSFKDGLFLLHSFVELALTTGNQKRRKIRRRDPRFHVDALLVQKRRYRLPDRPSRRQLFSTTHTPTRPHTSQSKPCRSLSLNAGLDHPKFPSLSWKENGTPGEVGRRCWSAVCLDDSWCSKVSRSL